MSILIGAQTAGAVISTITSVTDSVGNYTDILNKSSSLVGATGALRVEPLTLVDSEILALPVMGPLLQTNLSLFVGFWLQALALESNKVNGVKVRSILDPLNPNRDPDYQNFTRKVTSALSQENHSIEGYKHALPGTAQGYMPQLPQVAAEAKDASYDSVIDVSSLAVGKMIDVSIGNDDKKTNMPVSFRLMVAEMPRSVLHRIVSDDSIAGSRSDRWAQVVSGRISFVNDFLLCKDLVRARKKALAENKNGIYEEIKRRQAQHKKAGLVSGNRSLAEASNIVVISKDTADSLAEQFGQDISNFTTRQAIFDRTGCMMLVVVNTDHERVVFYYDTVRNGTSLGWGDLKVTNKGSGPNIMDIFTALTGGRAPSL